MRLIIADDELKIRLDKKEKVLGVKRSFSVKLRNIRDVSTHLPRTEYLHEIRAPGTFFPRVLKAGTYYTRRGKEFWYVRKGRKGIMIKLKHEKYRNIMLTIDDNEAAAKRIMARVKDIRNGR